MLKPESLRVTDTGSERLDFVVGQVWGPAIAQDEVRALTGPHLETGWEIREKYWVVPAASSAQLLIPCSPRVAARSLAEYAALRSFRTRVVRRSLAALATTGAPLSRDTLRIVARPGSAATVVAELGAIVGHPSALASLGVRTGANAKPTLELRTTAGNAIGFAKLAWNEVSDRAVARESAALRSLGSASVNAVQAPRLLADGLVGGRRFLMTEALPQTIADVPATWRSLNHAEALGPGTVRRRCQVGQTAQAATTLAALEAYTYSTPRRLLDRARDLALQISQSEIAVSVADLWHGDFVPWNVGRDGSGRLWLFDWETCEPDVPAGLDTIHWFTNTRGGQEPASLVSRLDAATVHASGLLRSLGNTNAGVAVLAAWYAVSLAVAEIRLAELLQSWERVKHSPTVLEELLEWGLQKYRSATEENLPK